MVAFKQDFEITITIIILLKIYVGNIKLYWLFKISEINLNSLSNTINFAKNYVSALKL